MNSPETPEFDVSDHSALRSNLSRNPPEKQQFQPVKMGAVPPQTLLG